MKDNKIIFNNKKLIDVLLILENLKYLFTLLNVILIALLSI
jgi:hypothetical protein